MTKSHLLRMNKVRSCAKMLTSRSGGRSNSKKLLNTKSRRLDLKEICKVQEPVGNITEEEVAKQTERLKLNTA